MKQFSLHLLKTVSYTHLDVYKRQHILDATYELDLFMVIGAPFIHMNKLYNCAIALCGGEILGVIPKTYIPTYNEFYEGRHFASAPQECKMCIRDSVYDLEYFC